ncbi:ammonium transporter [Roseovarius indicus]|uniref:Ammonia transporter n=1 Tax=Roseovarius indicus TaxID=540747 RepID=A0A5P3A8Z6_9RHOB|nr:ammonium transporter [Roseovarius indicus]QEW25829.1 Ammonia transporter [Roseovarius indicus]SFD88983.1 ammonium transporter, Amt family [Roseovarius indicus]
MIRVMPPARLPRAGLRVCAVACTGLMLSAQPGAAEIPAETAYVLNSLSFLYHGMLVFFMATGFSMLEGGLVRTKSVSTILLKNVILIAVAMIGFYLVGYNLMFYNVDGGYWGTPRAWSPDQTDALSQGAAPASIWLFQTLFAVTAVSIISGTLAERMRLLPFFVFVAFMSCVLYPVQGAWGWGGGWLAEMGFLDFAGGTHVHSAAGWAALTGAIVLGPRRSRFADSGEVRPMAASSLPLVTLGTMILWLGWLGFNGGSQGSMDSVADVIAIANIYVNTLMATCGGIVATAALLQLLRRKIDLTMVLNGALAGLVSITAGPDTSGIVGALLIGAVGGCLMLWTTHLLLRLRIDDVIGAIPVHLACGIWGTLVVSLHHPEGDIRVQLIGVAAVAVFCVTASVVVWIGLRRFMRLRLSQGEEAIGIDRVETGALAYPEFATRSVLPGD